MNILDQKFMLARISDFIQHESQIIFYDCDIQWTRLKYAVKIRGLILWEAVKVSLKIAK